MKIFRNRFAGVLSAVSFAVCMMAAPAALQAQTTAKIHGHVTNPIGQPVTNAEVRLTTDKNPGNKEAESASD